jgi:hypothetical protein
MTRLLAAAFIAGVALAAAPSAALACSGGVSAVNVYKECLTNGGSGGGGKHSGGGSQAGNSNSSSTPPPVSRKATKALAHSGKDKTTLARLYALGGGTRLLQASHAQSPTSEPTAIGSAFDLGSGPTALLIALAGTAVLLLAMTGVRGARRRR